MANRCSEGAILTIIFDYMSIVQFKSIYIYTEVFPSKNNILSSVNCAAHFPDVQKFLIPYDN